MSLSLPRGPLWRAFIMPAVYCPANDFWPSQVSCAELSTLPLMQNNHLLSAIVPVYLSLAVQRRRGPYCAFMPP